MKRLQLIDYILIAEGILMVVFIGIIIARPAPPCIESLDITRGQNFNQPILTKHNCVGDEVPTNWRDFEAK